MRHADLVDYLNELYEKRKAKNRKYSLRAFAKSLEIHSGTLALLMQRTRPMTAKQALRLLDRLEVRDDALRLQLIGGVAPDENAGPLTPTPVDPATFSGVRDWENSAILTLCILDPDITAHGIAQRLRLTVTNVQNSLAKLISAGLLDREGEHWRVREPNRRASSPVPSEDLKECHRQYLDKARESLDLDPRELRDISGITITASPDRIPLVREAIREFRARIAKLMDGPESSAVYRLNVQLFPLTKDHLP